MMFDKSATLYDFVYSFKDYAAEAEQAHHLIQANRRIDCRTLLDVGCGTGLHLQQLQSRYTVAGLDMEAGLLDVARERLPDVPLHQGDMRRFDLGQQFDAITCLFGAIAYVRTIEALRETLVNFAHHLNPGGVLVLEPFLKPEDIQPGKVYSLCRDEPELKVARFSNSTVNDNLMTVQFHYLVGSAEGISYFTETHELGLFTAEQIRDAMTAAGFVDVQSSSVEVFGRGIYVAVKA
jgi:ubiquinone/menaquinone biosynthesis C-methylase UbiE